MTATVVDLSSRRRNQHGPSCTCYPHRLLALQARLDSDLDATHDQLLIGREYLTRAVEDARQVINDIAGECLPENERDIR